MTRTSTHESNRRVFPTLAHICAIILMFTGLFSGNLQAQTNTWTGGSNSNWGTAWNWSLNQVPTASHDVVIPNGVTSTINVNVTAVCKSLTMNGGGTANTLTITSSNSLTVTNGITLGAGTGSNDHKTLNVNAGTLTAASITMTATGSSNRQTRVIVSTGTVNISGNISMGANNFFNFTSIGRLNIGGNIAGGTLNPGTGTVNFVGSAHQVITGSGTSNFYNVTINKTATSNSIVNSGNAMQIANSLTVTTGSLYLDATNTNTVVTGNVYVGTNGRIIHRVNWDVNPVLFQVRGNLEIDGVFNYTVRSHVQMWGTGNKTVRTGNNSGSNFSILTLQLGNFAASGTLKINDNFWAMFSTTGTFSTNGNNVTASAALLNAGGKVLVNGGSLNVSGGLHTGYALAGELEITSGTLNTDFWNLGDGSVIGTASQSGGTFNITSNAVINSGCVFTCTNTPSINIGGNWVSNNNNGFVPGNSTVTFNSAGAQQFLGSATTQTFHHLVINKPTQTVTNGGSMTSITTNGDLRILQGEFVPGSITTLNVKGNWENNATFTGGTTVVSFSGNSAQNITGSVVTAFPKMVINNAAGVNLSGVNAQITSGGGALNFSNGLLNTGSNKITLANVSTITGGSPTRYINGILEWYLAPGNITRSFPIGDATTATPLTLTFSNVSGSGSITVFTTPGDHANITSSNLTESRSVNRIFSITNSGLSMNSYNATFRFAATDLDPYTNTAQLQVGRYNGGWIYPNVSSRTATSIAVTGLNTFGTFAIAQGGATPPSVATHPENTLGCIGYSSSISATFTSNVDPSSYVWEVSTNGGASYFAVPLSAPYSISDSQDGDNYTATLTINPVAGGMNNFRYRVTAINSRGSATTNGALLTITTPPVSNAGSVKPAFCSGGTSAPLGGSVSNATGGIWSSDAGGTFSPSATDLNATWTPPAAFHGTATLTLTATGSCGPITDSKTQVVTQGPDELMLNSNNVDVCMGATTALSVTNLIETTTASSGTINQSIPNNNSGGTTHSLAVAGIPSNAVIRNVRVTMNVSHGEVSELIMNLKAPNGNIINLANRPSGGNGDNFTNTVVASDGTTTFASSSSPFTGTYAADKTLSLGPTGNLSNTNNFANLYSVPNGNWTLIARDIGVFNSGSISNWSITIEWAHPITWAPHTDLFTNAEGTTPYSGQALHTVYAKGVALGSSVYTATATSSNDCTRSAEVTVNVHALPDVTISANYCYGPYTIQLTGSADIPSTYTWNTGASTASIILDIAGTYKVTATTAYGCATSDSISLGLEMIDNGDFSQGNTGFTSAYGYVSNTIQNGMMPEERYTVHNDANFTHPNFWGKDHTTGTGNFMIVNGSGSNPPPNVWQKTISVIPNTTYYFSAWAISLNSVGPFANLQFNVNGMQVGTTTGALPARPQNNNPPFNWTRFFGTWNSGPNTTAVVSIVDLELAAGGNDFGLDDISFGTLAPFIKLNTIGKDTQVICKNSPIDEIEYTIGGGTSGPLTTGLPPGVTANFVGTTLTISGTPTVAGVYDFTVQTTGDCNIVYKYGRITVNEQTLALTSEVGSDDQIVCILQPSTPITYAVGGVATGANVTGLPPGVSGSYSGGVLTISGTPISLGTFNYTVTTTGSCTPVSLPGTITVVRQLMNLSSGAGSNNQTVCINASISNITYDVSGSATGASASGLPDGVTGTYNNGVFTISGTPVQAGTFNYSVVSSGMCNPVTRTGTIVVNQQTITLTSAPATTNQSLCINTGITNIVYNIGGSATGANVSGLPAGVSGNYNAGAYTISGTPTEAGVFNYTVTTTGTCTDATATGTIEVYAVSLGGTITNGSVCAGGNGTLTLTGYTGNIIRWETSTNGVSWTNISNTTASQDYSNITSARYYRAVTQTGTCGESFSNAALVGVHNLWTGDVDNDWNNTANWSDGQMPSPSCADVVIPSGLTNYPEMTYGSTDINNLIIQSGASITVADAVLQISGTITNNGTMDFTQGTLELNGGATQTIAGNFFTHKTIHNLIISNGAGVQLSGVNDTLKVTGEISFGANNAVLHTNGNLTLASNINGTARVSDLTNGGLYSGTNILGDVTVERYIPQHPKAWQLIAVPTKGSATIKSTWQEGNSPLANINPGYGSIITGNVSGAVAQGFDVYTPAGASLKTYNSLTNVWDGVPSTNIPIENTSGYMFLIRGDRSVITSSAPATATTLRTTGQLYTTGVNAPSTKVVDAGKFASIGNPYASAVDFSKLTITGGIGTQFYVWDPRLTIGTSYGLGAYQTFTWTGSDFIVTPGGGSYTNGNTNIESGQAFLVHAPATSGTITFTEAAKVSGHNLVHRSTLGYWEMLRWNLYSVTGGSRYLMDGVMTQFNPSFSNAVDQDDAIKLNNVGESVALVRSNTKLAVESRSPLQNNDTLFLQMSQMRIMQYQFDFIPRDLEGYSHLQAFLEDEFMDMLIPISLTDTTRISFSVTSAPGSYAPNRFRLVFKEMGALPVTFTQISATRKNDKSIDVRWHVENEISMQDYVVERSGNGRDFTGIANMTPRGSNGGSFSYHINDRFPLAGNNYYRIRGNSLDGTVQYSATVLVKPEAAASEFMVYPNPVQHKTIRLNYTNIEKGDYSIQVVNAIGQVMYDKQVTLDAGQGNLAIPVGAAARGVYHLRISGKTKYSQQVIIE